MIFKSATFKQILVALSPVVILLNTCPDAQARLGDTIGAFRAKNYSHYQFKSEKKKDKSTAYYIFSLIIDKAQLQSAPQLAGGITVTVTDGLISGQSMAVRIGSGDQAAKLLAVAHCLEFVYEAIGKKTPTTRIERENEVSAFLTGADQALGGAPQCVRYKGFHAKITLSRTMNGDLLVGVSPEKIS